MLNKTITNRTKSECREVSAAEIKFRITSAVFSQIHGTEAERCLNPVLRTRFFMSCTGLPQCIEGFGLGGKKYVKIIYDWVGQVHRPAGTVR